MLITKTSVVFILLSLGLGVCGFYFLKAFGKVPGSNKTGFLLSIFIFLSAIQNAVLGLGTLFFTNSEVGLQIVFFASQILLVSHAMVGIYTIYFIFYPTIYLRISIFSTSLLGGALIVLSVLERPKGFMTQYNSLDWKLSFPLSFLTFALLLISIGSFIYIFIRLYMNASNSSLKIFSLALSFAGVVALIGIFIKFVLLYQETRAIGRYLLDSGIGIAAIIFLFTLIFLPSIKRLYKK